MRAARIRHPGYAATVRIGPYELSNEIGRGGTGAVFKARAADGTDVALKLLVSQHMTGQGDLYMAMLGASGMLAADSAIDGGRWQMEFLGQWSAKIGGGTDEIQRNTIGEKVLALPPEPRVDKNIPFRDIPR